MLALKIFGKLVLGFISVWLLVALIKTVNNFYFNLSDAFWLTFISVWVLAFVTLEILYLWREIKPFPRILKHLRYAPLAVTFFFLTFTAIFDVAMVQHSKYQIRVYVYSSAPSQQDVILHLHNTDRGWCGNGRSATEYWLYADTAAEGFTSSDAAVRARSLRVSLQVYDWLNGVKDGPFPQLIKQAAQDEDPLVREMATDFLKNRKDF